MTEHSDQKTNGHVVARVKGYGQVAYEAYQWKHEGGSIDGVCPWYDLQADLKATWDAAAKAVVEQVGRDMAALDGLKGMTAATPEAALVLSLLRGAGLVLLENGAETIKSVPKAATAELLEADFVVRNEDEYIVVVMNKETSR
jgi:hypothetical protein